MNLGVHYPSDVLAGAIVGAGSAYVTYLVNDWFWKKQQNKRLIGLQAYL
jgi:membrane-associated phospholipid phosphatase